MKLIAIIQARMTSTRLPGKVLVDIAGRSMLARVVERVQRIPGLSEVVVATTTSPQDEPVVEECRRIGVAIFRGSENDVLDRYWQACNSHKADGVVRIRSDCPLIDPGEAGWVVDVFLEREADFAANDIEPSYPMGMGTEVMTAAALETAWREAWQPYERQHVSPYIFRRPERFRLINVAAPADYSHLRWTVDTRDDLDFVQAVYARLGGDGVFDWRAVLDLLRRQPVLLELNRQKAIEEC